MLTLDEVADLNEILIIKAENEHRAYEAARKENK